MIRASKLGVPRLVLSGLIIVSAAYAQQPLLQITSPANLSVAPEGQTLTISISADPSVNNIYITTESPLPGVQPTSSSTQFTLPLPTNVTPGVYQIAAVGVAPSGYVESAPILIDVERQDAPVSITVQSSLSYPATFFTLQGIGSQMPVAIYGTYADGTNLYLSNSTQTGLVSNNTAIAAVSGASSAGPGVATITATGAGETSIIVSTYAKGSTTPSATATLWATVTIPPPGPAPVITSISTNTGTPGVTQVTVNGSNFGSAPGSGYLELGNRSATVIATWTPNQIVATVPLGSNSGVVLVKQNGLASNSFPFTTIVPSISGVNPSSGTTGTPITISGANFGTSQGSSAVMFNRAAATPSSWAAGSIVAPVPAGATTGNIIVSVGGSYSNAVAFTATPTITSLSPTSGSWGTPVTITGTNFGNTQGPNTVTFNGVAATPTSWGAGAIAVAVPSGATTGPVVVTVNGIASNGPSFTVIPSITSLSPTTGAVGASVTITGTDLGSSQGSTVKFNGTTATTIGSWTPTQIVATVPTGATTGNVVVNASGVNTNGVSFTVVAAPSITTLSPTSGGVGTSVTITGTNFGSTQGTGIVNFNSMAASSITSWSSTQIVATVPTGATTGNVVVYASGVNSNGVAFTVLATPNIAYLSPTTGAVGASVTLFGTNFGTTQGASTLQFNTTSATSITSWSAGSITAAVPTGATTGNVVVTVNGVASNGSPFTVAPAPIISSLSPTSGTVGTQVTITGTSFGSTQGTLTFNGYVVTPTTWTPTSITCVAPGPGPVVVTAYGVTSNAAAFAVSQTIAFPTIPNQTF